MARKNYEKIDLIHQQNIDPDRRIIYLIGNIEPDIASQFIKNLNYLTAVEGDITIYIMTPGGYWTDGMAIYQAIKQAKAHNITGIALGECSSMGSVILQAFDKRIAFADTTFLVHPGNTSSGENAFVHNFINQAKYEERILERMYEIYYGKAKKITKLSFKKFKNFFSVDKYLSPEKALEMGLIDEIKGE
jgi:ATP-dependent Clp protease protease subunit